MLYTPDTLSRVPLSTILDNPTFMSINDIEMFVQAITNSLPADKDRLNVYRKAQTTDPECSTLIKYCEKGWPSHKPKGELGKYWQFKGGFSLSDKLLLYDTRIVIPTSMRQVTLNKIHQSHQGIQRCRLRVSTSVWWPGVSRDMEHFIRACPECQKTAVLLKEPMLQADLPSYP